MRYDIYRKLMETIISKLNQITVAVIRAAESPQLEEALQHIVNVARELVGASYAALGIPDDKGGLYMFKVAGISDEQIKAIGHLPVGKGLLGAIMSERQTIRLNNMADNPRSSGFPAHHPPMQSLLGVPIVVGGQLFGTFYLCNREDGQPFTQEDQWIIEILAGYAALAISGVEVNQQRNKLALLEDRERIRMELHDGVIQSLYALGMHVELMRQLETVPPSELDTVVSGLNDAIEQIRHFIMNILLQDYSSYPLNGMLEEIIQRFHLADRVAVTLDCPAIRAPFTPAVAEGVCHILNEAVSNVARHSQATQFQITVEQRKGWIEFRLIDNGTGFDDEQVRSQSGLGLSNMERRALAYGGEVVIRSVIGNGTELLLRLPTVSR
ncbi:MAG: GAF domain-containing protein [Phototrophicaceae bacterium]